MHLSELSNLYIFTSELAKMYKLFDSDKCAPQLLGSLRQQEYIQCNSCSQDLDDVSLVMEW